MFRDHDARLVQIPQYTDSWGGTASQKPAAETMCVSRAHAAENM